MWPVLFALLSASPQHEAALQAFKQHRFAEAVAQFTEALKTEEPGSAEYQESVLLTGQSLFLDSKYADAIPWLEKATAGKTVLPEASYMLGNACILARQSDKAVKAFAQLFQIGPDSAGAHVVTARMMMHKDLTEDAAREAKRAIEIDPKVPEAHFLLGEVAIFRGDLQEAIAHLKQEIDLDPTHAMAHYRLGDALGRDDKWREAMGPLERSVWLNPNFSGPFILLGKGYLKLKELANADGVLRHALRLDPQNLSAHYLLGQTLMLEGKQDEAQKEFARWQELKGKE